MSKVALLLLFKLCGSQGPEIFLQLHSTGSHWRFFGGHVKKNETPLDTIIREMKEELNIKLGRQEMSEGWTIPQLMFRLRIPFGGIYFFPVEVNDTFPPDRFEIREGLDGQFWPIKALPSNMSLSDKLLIKMWMLRRFVLNQPYIVTPLKCPVITIDLEEPYHFAGRSRNERFASHNYGIVPVIMELLDQLELAEATATFFCVADTAQKHFQLVREISRRGHEVASHGISHRLAPTQTQEEFKEDITISKKILEDITQQKVWGYRASGWSWPRDKKQRTHFYKSLKDAGYLYDSSVIPSALIGIPGFPNIPFQTEARIWEFPLPTFGIPLVTKNLDRFAKDGNFSAPPRAWLGSLGWPYSGGLFRRCLGPHISNLMLSYHIKKKGYAMTYIHPHELTDKSTPWILGLDDRYLNLIERWQVGFRTKKFKMRFYSLIATYSGCTIRQFLKSAYGL